MPALNSISVDKLARLIGLPHAPVIIDVCSEDDFVANHLGMIPTLAATSLAGIALHLTGLLA